MDAGTIAQPGYQRWRIGCAEHDAKSVNVYVSRFCWRRKRGGGLAYGVRRACARLAVTRTGMMMQRNGSRENAMRSTLCNDATRLEITAARSVRPQVGE
jgi:hypothetical protein